MKRYKHIKILVFIISIALTAIISSVITFYLVSNLTQERIFGESCRSARVNVRELKLLQEKKYNELKTSIEHEILVELGKLSSIPVPNAFIGNVQQLAVEAMHHKQLYPESLTNVFKGGKREDFIKLQYLCAKTAPKQIKTSPEKRDTRLP